jgi:hypothetical protein
MIGAAFGLAPGDEGYEELRLQWFDRYQSAMAVHSTLFDGIGTAGGHRSAGMAWGIVTNKPARFTDPLMPQIGLAHAGCIVSGDTTAARQAAPCPAAGRRTPPGPRPGHLLVRRRRPARHRSRPRRRHGDGGLRLGLLRRDRSGHLGRRLPARHAAAPAGRCCAAVAFNLAPYNNATLQEQRPWKRSKPPVSTR